MTRGGVRPALARLRRDRAGGVLPLLAAGLPALVGLGALAVDVGSTYTASRRLQGIADAAALAATADPAQARSLAEQTVAASGWTGTVTTEVTGGSWRTDAAPDARFTAATMTGAPAVRVRLTGEAPLFLATIFGRRGMTIARTATASARPMAAFSVGSRLASLDGGVANALLSALTGSSVSLSVLDHRALIDADIDLFAFSDALRTRLRLTGMTYDQVLAADMTTIDVIEALTTTLQAAGNGAAAQAAAKLRGGAVAADVDLSRLIDLGAAGAGDTAPAGHLARVSAGALLNATLGAATGNRQLALDLGASVPGLAATRVWIAIGDRPVGSPWLAVADTGTPVLRTAQARIYLETQLGVPGLAQLRLPLLVEAAEAEARLSRIDCATAAARAVTLEAKPAPATLSIAEIDRVLLGDHGQQIATGPARLIQTPLLSVTGDARVATGGAAGWQQARFTQADIDAGLVRTVSSTDLSRSIAASLTRDISLQVRALGLVPVDAGGVARLVGGALGTAAPAIDGVLFTLLDQLGIGLGEADLRVSGLRCGQPVLVA